MSWLSLYISVLYCANINTSVIFHSLFIPSIILNHQHYYASTFHILFYRLWARWLILSPSLLLKYHPSTEMSVPTTDPSTMPGDFQQQAESSTFGNIGSNRPRPPPSNRPNPGSNPNLGSNPNPGSTPTTTKKPDFKKPCQTAIPVTNLVTLTGKDNYQV